MPPKPEVRISGQQQRGKAGKEGPRELEERCVRRAECAGEEGWAAVCAGGAEGSVAGQRLMGERANEKLRSVSRKEQGDLLKWGRAQRGVCLHLGGVCEDARRVGWQEPRGFPACACWSCQWRRRQIFPRGRKRPDPVSEAVTQSWTCPSPGPAELVEAQGTSGWWAGLWSTSWGLAVPVEGSRDPPAPPRRPQRLL